MITRKTALALSLALGRMVVATTAHAQSLDDRRTVVVSYHDLNIATDAGKHTMHRRLFAAAHTVCDATANAFDLVSRAQEARCMHAAMAQAMSDLDASTRLTVASR